MSPSVPQTSNDAGGGGGGSSPTSSSSGGGNEDDSIKVAVRFRPLNSNERKHLRVPPAGSDDDDLIRGRAWRVLPGPTHSIAQREVERVRGQTLFSFDEAYDETLATPDVFDGVCRTVVDGAMEGIDGTIFAYGQTGSGKTFTMQGPDGAAGSCMEEDGSGSERDGIVQMAARRIFHHIASAPDREFLVRTSFVEVYNEVVRDLLRGGDDPSDGDGNAQLTVREDPKKGGVHMDCREVIVRDFASLMDTMSSGELNRIVASTDMNARSSRSHAIFRITVESREARCTDYIEPKDEGADETGNDDRAVLVSTLNLVDLAGSESVRHTGATGQRQREGGKINQSLLCLSQVINSLSLPKSKRPKHINYRDSKLTRILQASLSGNAKMAVLCCASPSSMYVEETRSTLKFASRAKMVQTKARKNEVLDDRALIRRLQRELSEARKALAAAEARDKGPTAVESEAVGQGLSTNQDSDEEREKLLRLKSMILHGGLGWKKEGDGVPRKGRAHLAQSLNPAAMRNTFHSSAPMGSSMRDLGQLQRQQRRCSVGVLQVASHFDSDVLVQIYEDDESDGNEVVNNDLQKIPETSEDTPPATRSKETGAKRESATDMTLTQSGVGVKALHSSSETDILREALVAKSELVRSLQLQLNASQHEVQLLEERIRFILGQSQCDACRSASISQPNNKSESNSGDEKEASEEELKCLRLQLHTAVVVVSSVVLYFGAEFLGIVH